MIHEAYLNASKRSRRIIPDESDYSNIDTCRIENYECLYQGKAGSMLVRFLFDFKNMKIVMAYPVLKEKIKIRSTRCYEYYDKNLKRFEWDIFDRIRK